MANELLEFTRNGTNEEFKPVGAVGLAESLVNKARESGQSIELSLDEDIDRKILLHARPIAVTRALENLVSNSARHATVCRLTVNAANQSIRFAVEDDGPGISADRREEAMRPFTRLDPSRNLDKGSGVGLGLSIARDVAVSHGGTLELHDSEALGGLKAVLAFPASESDRPGKYDDGLHAGNW